MKIVIISGFLGAGKTSFIKEMTRKTGRQFVVVENEFGELGLDGELLKQEQGKDGEMKIWELTEGCICCSLNLDFAQSVLTIANTLDPDYLLVEPSGVALPGRILEQLHKITYDRISLAAPITIVDGLHYNESRRKYPDYFENQVSMAGTIVVSKSEGFDQTKFEEIRTQLQLPPGVEMPLEHYSRWDKEAWFQLLNREMVIEAVSGTGQPTMRFYRPEVKKEQELENISIKYLLFKNPAQVAYVLNLLTTGMAGRIARAKGYCEVGKHWVKFDLVEGMYAVTGCEEMPDERVVVIGQNLNMELIRYLFTRCFM